VDNSKAIPVVCPQCGHVHDLGSDDELIAAIESLVTEWWTGEGNEWDLREFVLSRLATSAQSKTS